MKKSILILCIVLSVIACFILFSCHQEKTADEEYYSYKINTLLKDEDFYTAQIKGDSFDLYNSEQTLLKTIHFDEYDNSFRLNYIRKEGCKMYFVQSGSVDDEEGIVFINDESNNILDGIKKLKRCGGNSYYYSTWE